MALFMSEVIAYVLLIATSVVLSKRSFNVSQFPLITLEARLRHWNLGF